MHRRVNEFATKASERKQRLIVLNKQREHPTSRGLFLLFPPIPTSRHLTISSPPNLMKSISRKYEDFIHYHSGAKQTKF